jgi:SAM-dependent methyltransferase
LINFVKYLLEYYPDRPNVNVMYYRTKELLIWEVNMDQEKDVDERKYQAKTRDERHALRWSWLRRPPVILDVVRPLYEHPNKRLTPYIKKGYVVADLACANGYYTFPIADLVGPEGKVYAVDLGEKCIHRIQKIAQKRGYLNIEAHAASVVGMDFIKDRSIDLVWADGLLCSMEGDRQAAVEEIKRILKQNGQAYLGLGGTPPWGLVDQTEWEEILKGFKVEQGGSYKELWALVSLQEGGV